MDPVLTRGADLPDADPDEHRTPAEVPTGWKLAGHQNPGTHDIRLSAGNDVKKAL